MTEYETFASGSNMNTDSASSNSTNGPSNPSGVNHGRQIGTVLQSPCFVHSYLDSGLGNIRKETSYFDGQQYQSMPSMALPINNPKNEPKRSNSKQLDTVTEPQPSSSFETQEGTESSVSRARRPSSRPQPMHRGMRGAVEPESEDEDGSASSGASSASTSQEDCSSYDSSDDHETRVRSLTRQLAETAVGVREMSKQLGRARVKSTIQSVMIITKARDNHLIKLTRELAIWLMSTPRNGRETGLIVYVDSQLRTSKRFDAEGIRRDHPNLFGPQKASNGSTSNIVNEQEESNDTSLKSIPSSSNGSRTGSITNLREESLLRYWTSDMCSRSPHLFDFVVTLGGDGTVLFCSWLFQRIVPPVMPFALGSLGFLTNFDFKDYQKVLKSALDTGIRVNLRMRFTATVYRATRAIDSTLDRRKRRAIKSGKTGEIIMKTVREGGWESIERSTNSAESDEDLDAEMAANPNSDRPRKDKEIMCFSTRPVETFEVLNDLVVDRGPSPYVSLLEVFGDEHHLTTAQADGLCISTPTGSTAYSLSAGGSLVHPEIPAILISPICPHTLSFRPMLLPDSMELRIAVPYNSRSTAWASFDGRGRVELKQGDHIKVTASRYPFPTVCAEDQSIDWFESISRTLKWNERQRQKSFVVVEEGDDEQTQDNIQTKGRKEKPNKTKDETSQDQGYVKQSRSEESDSKSPSVEMGQEEDDDDDEDEDDDEEDAEEEKFDIDDTSTTATRTNSPMGTRSGVNSRRMSSTSDATRHHHHHHHHHSHQHRTSSTGTISSLPGSGSSSASSLSLFGLKPMTAMTSETGQSKSKTDGITIRSALANKVTFDSSSISSRETDQKNDFNSYDSSSTSGKYQHGVVHPSSRSLLDSPDRFGLAGPPGPPRALSERHLANADFRLDDSSEAKNGMENSISLRGEEEKVKQVSTAESEKNSERPEGQISSPQNANDLRESILHMAENNAKIASGSNKLYRKLKGKTGASRHTKGDPTTKQENSNKFKGGFELGRIDSRKSGGAALIVYGQDESDSDSTAEG